MRVKKLKPLTLITKAFQYFCPIFATSKNDMITFKIPKSDKTKVENKGQIPK